MTIAKTGTVAIGAAATLLLLSACGGSAEADPDFLAQSPRAITRAAFAAMDDLTSVRILGEVETDHGRIRIDLRSDDEGNCAGSLRMEHGNADLIHTSTSTWIRPDSAYWRGAARSPEVARKIIAEVGSSWTVAPRGAIDVKQLCDARTILTGFDAHKDGGVGRLSKGAVEVVGETESVAINEKGRGQSATVWVSVADPHRVVKTVTRERRNSKTVTFEEFGLDVGAQEPATDEVVDVSAYALRTAGTKAAQKKG